MNFDKFMYAINAVFPNSNAKIDEEIRNLSDEQILIIQNYWQMVESLNIEEFNVYLETIKIDKKVKNESEKFDAIRALKEKFNYKAIQKLQIKNTNEKLMPPITIRAMGKNTKKTGFEKNIDNYIEKCEKALMLLVKFQTKYINHNQNKIKNKNKEASDILTYVRYGITGVNSFIPAIGPITTSAKIFGYVVNIILYTVSSFLDKKIDYNIHYTEYESKWADKISLGSIKSGVSTFKSTLDMLKYYKERGKEPQDWEFAEVVSYMKYNKSFLSSIGVIYYGRIFVNYESAGGRYGVLDFFDSLALY
ncbi:hypothetical protein [Metamycoplasma hyosynoviae]|uniref:hypothetical protein n=1 Tax=Metamycoplasma hyosynoviae TaxID=29559 RepID=UPI000461B28F|nr:hypothetical protein [Metamycoplasma hyosynoviae]KDE43049.1 hypothetical protein NPL1_01795 [Metamycoplasma hyosynoviae]MDC8914762.1 hypothetical protein [Metamycoplasma hyosynoviae]